MPTVKEVVCGVGGAYVWWARRHFRIAAETSYTSLAGVGGDRPKRAHSIKRKPPTE